MNLQQFRFLREAARQKFNITAAARVLHTSQPGISKAIIDLEEELGVSIFARAGKRILGLTPPGQQVLLAAERVMEEIDNFKKLSRDYAGSPLGTLRVATTHTQARYVLPPVVQKFAEKFPQVRFKLLQADPPQIAQMLINGQADVGIATESLADAAGLRSIPVYDWQHVAIVPPAHALAKFQTAPGKLTLKDLARNPLVTYEAHFTGRSKIDAAFSFRQHRAVHRAGGDRCRRHQDLRPARHGGGHRRGRSGRSAARSSGDAAMRPPVRDQHHAAGGQAGRLSARLCLFLHRAADAPMGQAQARRGVQVAAVVRFDFLTAGTP
jgi:DNA-binding transcriptional LysR family regulator